MLKPLITYSNSKYINSDKYINSSKSNREVISGSGKVSYAISMSPNYEKSDLRKISKSGVSLQKKLSIINECL